MKGTRTLVREAALLRSAALIAVSLICAQSLFAQTADEVMEKARGSTTSSDSMGIQARITTTKNGKQEDPLTITQYAKKDAAGRDRMVVIVNDGPRDFRNTRMLIMENASGGNDQWVFQPNMGKVRRITSSDSGESFAGTGFSYGDMSGTDREAGADSHSFVNQNVTYNGKTCWQIQSIPRDSDYEYSKSVSWVAKDDNRVYKTESYDKSGKLVMIMELSDYADDGKGHATPKNMRMTDLEENTVTVMSMLQIQFDMAVPENVFTTSYLETGRAR